MGKFSFDADKFADALNASTNNSVHNASDKHGWVERDGNAIHYKHTDYEYRTWRPDSSVCRNDGAIIISCKIDQRRSAVRKDDHVVLIGVFNREGHIIAAEAGAQSIPHGGKKGHTAPVIAKPTKKHPDSTSDHDLADRFEKELKAVIDKISSSDSGLKHLVHVAKDNLLAMRKGVVFQ